MTRLFGSIALALLALFAVAPAASAMTIEKIVSPSGITVARCANATLRSRRSRKLSGTVVML